jgi:hypothetical protein
VPYGQRVYASVLLTDYKSQRYQVMAGLGIGHHGCSLFAHPAHRCDIHRFHSTDHTGRSLAVHSADGIASDPKLPRA